MTIRDFLDQMASENYPAAEETFNALMIEKLSSAIEEKRSEIASNMFNESVSPYEKGKLEVEKDEPVEDDEKDDDDSDEDNEKEDSDDYKKSNKSKEVKEAAGSDEYAASMMKRANPSLGQTQQVKKYSDLDQTTSILQSKDPVGEMEKISAKLRASKPMIQKEEAEYLREFQWPHLVGVGGLINKVGSKLGMNKVADFGSHLQNSKLPSPPAAGIEALARTVVGQKPESDNTDDAPEGLDNLSSKKGGDSDSCPSGSGGMCDTKNKIAGAVDNFSQEVSKRWKANQSSNPYLQYTKEENELTEWAKAAPADDAAAHELFLHATNTQSHYASAMKNYVPNLQKKHQKGTYDHDKAGKLWRYHADSVAKDYSKTHGGTFSPATRDAVALKLRDHYDEDVRG